MLPARFGPTSLVPPPATTSRTPHSYRLRRAELYATQGQLADPTPGPIPFAPGRLVRISPATSGHATDPSLGSNLKLYRWRKSPGILRFFPRVMRYDAGTSRKVAGPILIRGSAGALRLTAVKAAGRLSCRQALFCGQQGRAFAGAPRRAGSQERFRESPDSSSSRLRSWWSAAYRRE